MEKLLSFVDKNQNLKIKMINDKYVTDIQYTEKQSLFLSDTISYIRLNNKNSIAVLNGSEINNMFSKFYNEIWEKHQEVIVDDQKTIKNYINHIIQFIQRLE